MWPMDGHMGWMGLWWLLALALLVLFVWALTRGGATPSPPRDDDSPEAILKRRYARGELDEQEFERRLSNLRK
jgi:putative membrane protein